jgi:hypothetical protein
MKFKVKDVRLDKSLGKLEVVSCSVKNSINSPVMQFWNGERCDLVLCDVKTEIKEDSIAVYGYKVAPGVAKYEFVELALFKV